MYAVLALAIVLIYQSTRVVNFARGEMAMLSTFIAWSWLTRFDYWPAFALTLSDRRCWARGWRCCLDESGHPNIEVRSTHIGLAFNLHVYGEVARLLATG